MALPDLNAQYSGPEILRQWVRQLWDTGEFLGVKTDTGAGGPDEDRSISLRLQTVHPARLDTPIGTGVTDHVMLGIEVSDTGRPLRYWIEDYRPTDTTYVTGMGGRWYDANQVIHYFDVLEPGQLRGVPWLSTSLQAIEDLRSYDEQVLDAARAAADFSVLLTTDHPDAKYFAVNEESNFKRRTIRTAPPGWKANQIQAEQPTTQYVQFRQERQRDLGRPAGMPLMMVRLDSSGHNYSSTGSMAKSISG